jgi:hypothetical protein
MSSTMYGLCCFGSTIIYSEKFLRLENSEKNSSEFLTYNRSDNYNIEYPIVVANTISGFGYLTELIGIIQFVALMLYYLSSTSYYLDRYYFIRKDKPNELLEALGETDNPTVILDCLYQDIKKKHMIGFMTPGLICCICIIGICIPNSFWTASIQFDYTNLGIYLVFAGRYAQIGTIAMFIFTLILPFILSILYSLVIFCKTQSSAHSQSNLKFKETEIYKAVRHRMIGMSIQIVIIILSTFINVLSIIKSYSIEFNFCEDKFQIWLRLIQALLISIPIGFIRMKRKQDQSQSPTNEQKTISSNNEASN